MIILLGVNTIAFFVLACAIEKRDKFYLAVKVYFLAMALINLAGMVRIIKIGV